MGLFGTKKKCSVCDIEKGKYKIANGEYLCEFCRRKIRMDIFEVKKVTSREIKEFLAELETFIVTKEVSDYLEVDEKNKKFLMPLTKRKIYNFSDLLDFELLEDGDIVSKGGLGRALVGGALFGGVGAIVGGVTSKRKNVYTSLKIKIILNDIGNSVEYINFIDDTTPKDSVLHKNRFNLAQECLSILHIIRSKVDDVKSNTSGADEILKLKKLLDEGIITKEEFELKKKQLLGL